MTSPLQGPTPIRVRIAVAALQAGAHLRSPLENWVPRDSVLSLSSAADLADWVVSHHASRSRALVLTALSDDSESLDTEDNQRAAQQIASGHPITVVSHQPTNIAYS